MTVTETFAILRERGETALMPYLTAGYPSLPASADLVRRVDGAGADLLEIGVPFSDPVADGPVIQQASHEALLAGTTLRRVVDAFSRVETRAPKMLMSYLNPLLAYGERLLPDLVAAGFQGLIVPDAPLEESAAWRERAAERGLAWAPLVAPTTPLERAERIAAQALGFTYVVSVAGTTGARRSLPVELTAALDRLRERTRVPLAVGFGIADPGQIRKLAPHCDGVVVGSRLVRGVRDGEPIEPLIRTLKSATQEPAPC